MRIRRLPDHLVNKIAAGEVVERPASAAKELVENALDAAASLIAVDLRDGGTSLVRVSDDGIGMTAAELPLALERHATSKLPSDADLDAIATLGFRGEALAAIAGVSRFTITSRARDAAEGLRLAGEGGVIGQRLAVPAERGTGVEVRDLFFNTPARLKFLKSPATELGATLRAITQLALAQPAVRVHGVAGPPDLTRGGRDDIVIVINGRPVRDPALLQAALAAYRPLLARDRFPLVVLAIDMPAADVDANVHPTKAWVRFRHPRLVQEMLVAALHDALQRPTSAPAVVDWTSATPSAGMATTTGGTQSALFAETAAPYTKAVRFGRVLGQVQDTFIVATTEDEVFFLDQHVVHERVLFERLEAELAAGGAPSQALLFPETVELPPAARALLERWRAQIERLGFGFDGGASGTVLVTAVPTLLKGDEPRRLLEAAVDELGGAQGAAPAIDRALAFVACRAAVKADTPLAREEMERL